MNDCKLLKNSKKLTLRRSTCLEQQENQENHACTRKYDNDTYDVRLLPLSGKVND